MSIISGLHILKADFSVLFCKFRNTVSSDFENRGYFCYTESMQARFYANMRTVIGTSSLSVDDVKIDTCRKLITYLIELNPKLRFYLLEPNGKLRQDVPVFVDGRNPRLYQKGIDTPIKPDSVVSFFSPISSGRMNVEVLREANFGKGVVNES